MFFYLLHFFSPLLKLLAKIYTAKEREFSYKGINIVVKPGVFHPGLFFSTKILLNFVESLELKNKTFLELGCGTGIISILAAKKGGKVFSTDISKNAVENVKANFISNNLEARIIHCNMFEKIPAQLFDYIVINPPYFAKAPLTEKDYAWNCGNNFEYFKELFDGISNYINSKSKIYMILADICEEEKIIKIAANYGFDVEDVYNENKLGERNTIYSLKKN